jgi:hypothetical protein
MELSTKALVTNLGNTSVAERICAIDRAEMTKVIDDCRWSCRWDICPQRINFETHTFRERILDMLLH